MNLAKRQNPRRPKVWSRKAPDFDVSTADGQKRLMAVSMGLDSETYINRAIPKTIGDTGADPLGDGTFKMYPSGDVVDFAERNRRLSFRSNPRRRPKVWSRKALGLPARFGYADDPDAVDFITGKTPVEMGIKMKKALAPRATGTKPTVARFYRDPDTIDMFADAPRRNPRRRRNPKRPVGWGTGTKYRFSPAGIGNEGQVRLFCTTSLPSEYMPPPWVYGTAVGLMVGATSKTKAEALAKWFVAQPEWAWAEAHKTKKGTWYAAVRAWDSVYQALKGVTPF